MEQRLECVGGREVQLGWRQPVGGLRGEGSSLVGTTRLSQHYLELLLKHTLAGAQDLLDIPRNMPTTHRLDFHWRDLRVLVLLIYKGDDPSELAKIDVVVRELVELDRKSTAFRYPVDIAGKESLPEDLLHVNIRRFTEVLRPDLNSLRGLEPASLPSLTTRITSSTMRLNVGNSTISLSHARVCHHWTSNRINRTPNGPRTCGREPWEAVSSMGSYVVQRSFGVAVYWTQRGGAGAVCWGD